MIQQNTNTGQEIEPDNEPETPPHDPIEPDPMDPKPIPVPPDDKPPPAPVREPEEPLPAGDPPRRKPTEIV